MPRLEVPAARQAAELERLAERLISPRKLAFHPEDQDPRHICWLASTQTVGSPQWPHHAQRGTAFSALCIEAGEPPAAAALWQPYQLQGWGGNVPLLFQPPGLRWLQVISIIVTFVLLAIFGLIQQRI